MPIHKKITIANQNSEGPLNDGDAPPDHIQPFMLDVSQLKGRILRLPFVVNNILAAHRYPESIARLMAEALCLTGLLADMLKIDGIFTLQLKGEGALRTLVCDITTGGILRGYASFDKDAVAALEAQGEADFMGLTVKGYLALTVDRANDTERYQGITELSGTTLTKAVQHYFRQSEQIDTGFVTQITRNELGHWHGAAIMVQQLAREGGQKEAMADRQQADGREDAWRRCMILLGTLKPEELLQNDVPLNTILYNLFHEENVRVFAPLPVIKGCRCSPEKIQAVFDTLSADDKQDYAEDGVIRVTCEFCNTVYEFPVDAV